MNLACGSVANVATIGINQAGQRTCGFLFSAEKTLKITGFAHKFGLNENHLRRSALTLVLTLITLGAIFRVGTYLLFRSILRSILPAGSAYGAVT